MSKPLSPPPRRTRPQKPQLLKQPASKPHRWRRSALKKQHAPKPKPPRNRRKSELNTAHRRARSRVAPPSQMVVVPPPWRIRIQLLPSARARARSRRERRARVRSRAAVDSRRDRSHPLHRAVARVRLRGATTNVRRQQRAVAGAAESAAPWPTVAVARRASAGRSIRKQ